MKKKQAKLYIPVLYRKSLLDKEDYVTTSATLLNASKIPILKDILPDIETLQAHLSLQKVLVQKDNKYRPKPFEIKLEKSKFTDIIREIKKKNKDAPSNHIALFTAYPGVPICTIEELR